MDKIKKSKRDHSIQYRDHPNGRERCGLCTMFRPPDECTSVAGQIQARGWCKIFDAKD
jgi:hypothetical protein